MRFIHNVVNSAINQGVLEKENEDVAVYGLEWGFHFILGLFGLFTVGLALGMWRSVMLAAVVGSSFRFVSGGAHFNSSILCFVFTCVSFVVVTIAASLLAPFLTMYSPLLTILLPLVAALLGTTIVYTYVPAATANRPIRNEAERQKFRKLSFIYVAGITLIFLISLWQLTLWHYPLTAFFAFALQLFSLTPVGTRFFVWLDNCADPGKEGGDNQ